MMMTVTNRIVWQSNVVMETVKFVVIEQRTATVMMTTMTMIAKVIKTVRVRTGNAQAIVNEMETDPDRIAPTDLHEMGTDPVQIVLTDLRETEIVLPAKDFARTARVPMVPDQTGLVRRSATGILRFGTACKKAIVRDRDDRCRPSRDRMLIFDAKWNNCVAK